MATYRVRPSKPVAVLSAVGGAAIVVFGAVSMLNGRGGGGGFLYLWCAVGLAVIGFNLWSAFAPNGHTETITSTGDEDDDGPPARWGTRVERYWDRDR